MKTRKEWTKEESREFEAGLKKMGFKQIAPDAEDIAQGTVSWSLKLGPVKAAAKTKEDGK